MFVLTGLFLDKCFGFLNNGIITSFSDFLNSNLKYSGMYETNIRILNNPWPCTKLIRYEEKYLRVFYIINMHKQEVYYAYNIS